VKRILERTVVAGATVAGVLYAVACTALTLAGIAALLLFVSPR
jgi:hypothetical protein